MKIKEYKVLEDVRINISFSLEKENSLSINYTFTCPACGGYGCHAKPCHDHQKIDVAEMHNLFPKEEVDKIKKVIDEIHNQLHNPK